MNSFKNYSIFLFAGLALSSCNSKTDKQEAPKKMPIKGIDVSSIDKNLDPCSDFYGFANGSWVKNNPIPETESRWSNFNILRDKNDSLLKNILVKATEKKAEESSDIQKIGAFYAAAMDTVKINNEGVKAIQPQIDEIEAIDNNKSLTTLLANHHRTGLYSFFSSGVGQDIKNNTEHIVYIGSGSLGLPDRDYYLLDNPKFKEIRAQYLDHLQKMFGLMGFEEAVADTKAQKVISIETEMAKASLTRVERRNPDLTYNKMSTDQLSELMTFVDWEKYFDLTGITIDSVIISQPKLMTEINSIINSKYEIEDIKSMLQWNLINATAAKLSDELNAQDFNFYSTVLRGVSEMKPRWQRALSETNSSLGELVGKEYVKIAFSPENKKKVDEMVDNLISVFSTRIKNLDWMGEETKEQALTKLNAITRKLGYPDEWKDYSNLEIPATNSYVQNWFAANQFAFDEEIAKLGQPVNKKEWGMPPQTVNAYYNPVMNEIVFPAGILQPPFFDMYNDDAINYGSMGAVIGHELTHGFDDQGNRFDAEGNLKNWWTEADKENFNKLTTKVINQYSNYEVLDSIYINGALTLGENIADIGGLSIAYEAYMKSLEGKEKKEIDGFSPEQRFFISFAQVWRNNQREKALRQQVMTDPHSPAKYRVIGVLSNLKEFDDAFSTCGIKQPDSLKVSIW